MEVRLPFPRAGLKPFRMRRCAISLVVVVVVVAILGALLSLLLPAVQHVRASSRRISCLANLRQVSLAMHNHIEQTGRFPGDQYQRRLLPYIEQSALARRIEGVYAEFGKLEEISSFSHITDVSLPVYACPADAAQSIARGRAISCLMNVGSLFGDEDDAMRSHGHGIAPRDVTDGLSNTVAVSERLLYYGSLEGVAPVQGPSRDVRLRRMARTEAFRARGEIDAFAEHCRDNAVWLSGVAGTIPAIVGGSIGADGYNHIMTPNQNSCYNGVDDPQWEAWPSRYAAKTATSMHSGGVNVLMADGSGRFVSEAIERRVWRAVGTRNGGENIDAGAY